MGKPNPPPNHAPDAPDVPLWAQETDADLAPAIAFDFPLVYPMHTAGGVTLFTEDAALAEALGLPPVVATPKGGKSIPGWGARELVLAVLGLRVRWAHPDHPGVLTAEMEYPGQRSRAQLLCMSLDGTPLTLTGRSTATDQLRKAVQLAARASTRALVASRGALKHAPPLWTWRLRVTAHSEPARSRTGVAYTSREVRAAYAGPRDDLDGLCVPADVAAGATLLWRALGPAWLAAWAEAPAEEVEPDSSDDAAPGAPDAVARAAALRQAAAEAEARWDEAAAQARRLTDPTAGGVL